MSASYQKWGRLGIFALGVGFLVWFLLPFFSAKHISSQQYRKSIRGVSLGLFASDPLYDYGGFLDELVRLGATDVLIVSSWTLKSMHDDIIQPSKGHSPSPSNLRRTLRQARERGFRVGFMPTIRLARRGKAQWRGRLHPFRGVDAWFASYRRYILAMARVAAREGVVRFAVGSELLSMERYTQRWQKLIREVRSVYKGKVFYSANWDHFRNIGFVEQLDELGISGYFSLSEGSERPTLSQLRSAWTRPVAALYTIKKVYNKPIFFSEIGYPSLASAAKMPWDETTSAKSDLVLQRRLYRAFCDVFSKRRILEGFYMWNWFGYGGPLDRTFTPRGKPAAVALQRCLTQWK
ncbi:MAG TPA: hypothetical protein DCE42_01365 [Myxococcales bacterium]|nr:hypothetical protein [Deltaproteobacteria bacterium]MBU53032.1 hypothetical protein [Deltaproteobacteria bacterium]HAA53371.1 hypothetical protein [Myxococcales bacterium]|tara:strand:- start:425 stop:1474 length:1050 start_codon:yes stop_codon:yes gene_type:complete